DEALLRREGGRTARAIEGDFVDLAYLLALGVDDVGAPFDNGQLPFSGGDAVRRGAGFASREPHRLCRSTDAGQRPHSDRRIERQVRLAERLPVESWWSRVVRVRRVEGLLV